MLTDISLTHTIRNEVSKGSSLDHHYGSRERPHLALSDGRYMRDSCWRSETSKSYDAITNQVGFITCSV